MEAENFEVIDDGSNFPEETTGTSSCSCTAYPTFLSLTDTPNDYSGQGGNCVKVSAGETELEFGACAGGSETDPHWTANISNYFTISDILGFNYYNATDFDFNDYLLIANWNATNTSYLRIDQWNSTNTSYLLTELWNATNESYYLKENPFGYYNSTTLPSSSGGFPINVNLTSNTHNGSFVNGTLLGYSAGNSICNYQFANSHLCNEFEITLWYQTSLTNGSNNNSDAWMIAGSPKYIPATVPVNDCQGWTYAGTSTSLGNYWHFNNLTGGEGRAINCGTTLKLACCSY